MTILLVLIIIFGLGFDFVNGFHDTANAIATVVSTRVLSPAAAIIMAAVLNFCGALLASNVAKTIAGDIVTAHATTQYMVLAAIIGAIIWNLVTWYYGIPSSSSHALIGGLCGAAMANAGLHAVQWNGLLNKVLLPLVLSPLAGMAFGYILMTLVAVLFAKYNASKVGLGFRRGQIVSSAAMAFAHGQNDAQKTMGVITMALVANGMLKKPDIPTWVILTCATAMALGTAAGGWRIIKTVGHRIIRLEPVNGFAAETSGAAVILTASHFGMPVSTTHVITGSIFGVGAAKRLASMRWKVVGNMVTAWIITIPVSAALGAVAFWVVTR